MLQNDEILNIGINGALCGNLLDPVGKEVARFLKLCVCGVGAADQRLQDMA